MAAVWSTKLALRGLPSSAYTVVYTVPAGVRTVVKSVVINNDSGASRSLSMRMGPAAGDFPMITESALASHKRIEYTPWVVLNTGDQIRFYVDGSDVFVHASGYELHLP